MKTDIERFKQAIESNYESPGYFTEKQLIKMKKLRKQREKIYDELAKITSDFYGISKEEAKPRNIRPHL